MSGNSYENNNTDSYNGCDYTYETCSTSVINYITKDITTQNTVTDTTFKGNEVIDYSISPKGVTKALIDTKRGIVTFEKYNSDWCGEVTLSLETCSEDSQEEQYIHDITVNFESEDSTSEDSWEYSVSDDIIELTGEEKQETSGGRNPHRSNAKKN